MHFPFLSRRHARERSHGQTIVEFALILPVLVLLLLIALDFGRTFLGWVSLNNAARVGANYAALHPNNWDTGTAYEDLMAANVNAINCTQTNAGNPPAFGPTKQPGELVRVDLDCDFAILTPVIGSILGGTVTVSSSAAFPISFGCLAACPTGPPVPPPPPPADNCRTVPNVIGLSVAGARLAWQSAGFIASQFIPGIGDDTLTIDAQSVAESPNTEGCTGPERFFDSTMTVSTEPIDPVTAGCFTIPNMRGVAVATARDAWTDAGFTGEFLPTGQDASVVLDQVTDLPSDPGACMPPETTVVVTFGSGWPGPPPQPCKVPSFISTSTSNAIGLWTAAGFNANGLSFKPPGGLPYTIESQSLVGGTYIGCNSPIELGKKA